jgi:LacI family transcriptional regulator
VLVNRSDAGRKLPAVVTDDQAGMRLAVEHLASLGHVSIGHIAGPQTVSTGALRAAGFKAAAARAGLSAQNIAIEPARAYTREQGRLAALCLLDHKNLPTAIVAANDLLALGIYDALAARGLACPADVSVVGHNDMPYVDMLSPPLTTVRIAQRDIGNQAARLLLDAIAAPTVRSERVMLEPRLIVRGSTGKPRQL